MLDIFDSVADVWLIWLVCVTITAVLIRRCCARFSWNAALRFHRSETGASYALAYVLSFPIFLLLMAVLLQASLILVCKIGVTYAAYSTARTVTVWQAHVPENGENVDWGRHYMRYKAKRTATMAMVPFANSFHYGDLFPEYEARISFVADKESLEELLEKGALVDIGPTFANFLTTVDKFAYIKMYKQLNEEAHNLDKAETSYIIKSRQSRVRDGYIRKKYDYAAAATRIEVPESHVAWNEDLTVTVKYRMMFHLPGTARIFRGKRSYWSRVLYRDIVSTVTIPSEAAESETGRIGIPYNTFFLKLSP